MINFGIFYNDEYELEDEDDNEDFGLFDLDDLKETETSQKCPRPSSHYFEKVLLFNIYHDQCKYCGYSPELDSNKEEWEQCHREYIAWKKG